MRGRTAAENVEAAQRLGLAVARVASVEAADPAAPLRRMAVGGGARRSRPLVVDLSGLWAGPLCGALLAEAGARVVKVESTSRPDGARASSPAFFERLNGAKEPLVLDFSDPRERRELQALMTRADVVITSARARAFDQLGLPPEAVFAANPRLVWTAITAYGWDDGRVGFGDDAAAAGGLVRWTPEGPRFLGDALADPLTGLAAAAGTLHALRAGGGLMVDAALARTAAGIAAAAMVEAAA